MFGGNRGSNRDSAAPALLQTQRALRRRLDGQTIPEQRPQRFLRLRDSARRSRCRRRNQTAFPRPQWHLHRRFQSHLHRENPQRGRRRRNPKNDENSSPPRRLETVLPRRPFPPGVNLSASPAPSPSSSAVAVILSPSEGSHPCSRTRLATTHGSPDSVSVHVVIPTEARTLRRRGTSLRCQRSLGLELCDAFAVAVILSSAATMSSAVWQPQFTYPPTQSAAKSPETADHSAADRKSDPLSAMAIRANVSLPLDSDTRPSGRSPSAPGNPPLARADRPAPFAPLAPKPPARASPARCDWCCRTLALPATSPKSRTGSFSSLRVQPTPRRTVRFAEP